MKTLTRRRFVLSVTVLSLILAATAWTSVRAQRRTITFRVTVKNEFRQPVAINRVFDFSDRHIVKSMQPGEPLDIPLTVDSDQVFIVWNNGNILGQPIAFNPREFDRIGITIHEDGQVSTQLAARQ